MPELRAIPLGLIAEPELPIREAMDEAKMRELEESLAADGLINPLTVVADGEGFRIIAGHRRYMAARRLGWAEVRANVHQPGEINETAVLLAENLVREDITAAEEAIWFSDICEREKWDTEQLAAQVRRTRDYVEDRLRLLAGDIEVFNALRARHINFSVARELNKCPDESYRRMFLDLAVKGGHAARVVAGWVRDAQYQSTESAPAASAAAPADAATGTPPQFFGCDLCGGDRDPYNLVHVKMHKWEWEHIQRQLKAGAQQEA